MDDVVGQDVLISLLVSCASVISALFALVGCVEICRRKAGFRVSGNTLRSLLCTMCLSRSFACSHVLSFPFFRSLFRTAMSERCLDCCLSFAFCTAQCLSAVRDSVVECRQKVGRRAGYQVGLQLQPRFHLSDCSPAARHM